MPKISVIIPCYNQGEFIDDVVGSVLNQDFEDLEIIIVNDGSTDFATNQLLSAYVQPHTRVMTTINQGLPAARNNGIREAKGEYILPLDADDKIGAGYLKKAVHLLDGDPSLGIVYSHAELFGARSGRWHLPPYSLDKMLAVNIIFCSGVFRKSDWEQVGGYRTNMGYGYEDWDFWLSLLEIGRKVYCIPEALFHYRVRPGSMGKTISPGKKLRMYLQVYKNHWQFFLINTAGFMKGWMKFIFQKSHKP